MSPGPRAGADVDQPAPAHGDAPRAAPGPVTGRLTIRDVARAAGVSPATVSRALRGLDNVDLATKERIVALARDLNYSVSPTASRLATGRTGTIGIVTPFVGRWYFTEVFAGVEAGLKPYDVDLLLHVTESLDHPELPRAHERMRRRVDGALVLGLSPHEQDLREFAALDFPVVLLGARAPGFAGVCIDDREGARKATRHLVEAGHQVIGVITGRRLPANILPENDRMNGFLDVLVEHGLSTVASLRAVGDFTSSGGERAMARLLRHRPRPTAVFCMSDEMAYGALRTLRRFGVRAGGDRAAGEIAVIGFDGHDLAEAFELSTVAQPVRELGRTAAQLLMRAVEDPRICTELTLPTQLLVRASTSAVAADVACPTGTEVP